MRIKGNFEFLIINPNKQEYASLQTKERKGQEKRKEKKAPVKTRTQVIEKWEGVKERKERDKEDDGKNKKIALTKINPYEKKRN